MLKSLKLREKKEKETSTEKDHSKVFLFFYEAKTKKQFKTCQQHQNMESFF